MKSSSFKPGVETRYLAAKEVYAVVYKGQSLRGWANKKKQLRLTPTTEKFINSYLLGSLCWFIQNKAVLKSLLKSPIKEKDKIVEVLLCCAIYEITRMRTPNYAVVASTVEAVKMAQKSHLSSLANATLRNFIRDKGVFITKARSLLDGLYSFPLWFIEQTKKEHPNHWQTILDASNQIPILWLCVNTSRISLSDYQQQLLLHTGQKGTLIYGFPNAIGVQYDTNPASLPGFDENFFHIQTPGAQLAAEIMKPKKNDIVLDACAAPGGKALCLLNKEKSIKLTAVEFSRKRFQTLEKNFSHAQQNAKLICGDLLTPDEWWNKKKFTKILLDVPCSSSAVINRDYDIKHLRRQSDIGEYHQKQLKLLKASWRLLEKNGTLLYSTCSIFSAENSRTIKQFLIANKDAATLAIKDIPALRTWGVAKEEKGFQLIPGKGLQDGFFYALLHKTH